MSGFENAALLLPREIRLRADQLTPQVRGSAQEFRLRLGRKPSVTLPDGEKAIPGCEAVTHRDLQRVLELSTMASPYAAAEGIKSGFVAAPGGVRVGLCGRMRQGTGGEWAHRGLTSLAIRIPREIRGCGAPFCVRPFRSTLILSPPGAGKTTLLRDMVRLLSDGGARVALCDERGEVAAVGEDGPGFDLGERTDVLSDLPKHRAAEQLLRTMNPEILAMDEITAGEDVIACVRAAGCGVSVLATAHAGSEEELRSGPLYRDLIDSRLIRRLIWVRRTDAGREYEEAEL